MQPAQRGDLWVFGYGSLMWRPGFSFIERAAATVSGFHRAFCIASTAHRGTYKRPGLVLGLDRGGSCAGMAYRIAASEAASVLAYLRERELIYGVYRERAVRVELVHGAPHAAVDALAYTVERRHPAYAGHLPIARQAIVIRGASGQSGANLDYLINTVRHLQALGIRERGLERLMAIAAGFAANTGAADALVRPCVRGLHATWLRVPAPTHFLPPGDQRRFGYRVRLAGAWSASLGR